MKKFVNSPILWALLCGVLAGALLQSSRSDGRSEAQPGLADLLTSTGILRQAHADLADGDYDFFPNRKSVWVVNRVNGRMANYEVESDRVERSRVAKIDMRTFPREDTVIYLSDRNLTNLLWVCNARTGDVVLWRQDRDKTLKPHGPFVPAAELALSPPAGR